MRVKEGRRRASSFLLFVVLVATCVISSLVIITVSSRTSSDQVVSSSAAPPSALTTLVETIDRALPQGTPEEQPKGERGRPESPPRVAMLLPIIDKSLKDFFPYLLQTIPVNRHPSERNYVIDWFIIHEAVPLLQRFALNPPFPIPPNIRFIDVEEGGMATLFGIKAAEALGRQNVTHQIEIYRRSFAKHGGYTLAELKPMFGHVFGDIIKQHAAQDHQPPYTHWAWVDWDILWGDLYLWLEPSDLLDYDVFTIMSTPHVVYLRGQFTIFRNSDSINRLWMACPDLLSDDIFVRGTDEQCFSHLIATYSTLRIKYSPLQMRPTSTDFVFYWIDGRAFVYRSSNESMRMELTRRIRDHHSMKESQRTATDGALLMFDGFPLDPPPITSGSAVKQLAPKEQVFARENVSSCLTWIKPQYRVCLQDAEPPPPRSSNIFRVDGRFFRQNITYVEPTEYAFIHVHGWKALWKNTTHPLPKGKLKAIVMTHQGIEPLVYE